MEKGEFDLKISSFTKPESVTSQSPFIDLPIEVKHLAFI